MLAIVAEVVIRWAGTAVRSSSVLTVWSNWCLVWSGGWLAVGSRVVWSGGWLAVGSRVVWGSVVGSRVVRASKFAVAWASKGAVRSSIELTVSVVSGLSVVSEWELGVVSSWLVVMDDFLDVMVDWLGVMGGELGEGVMGSWELTEGVVSSWLVVVDDFLDVMVDWLAIRSSLVWGSVVGTSVVGTSEWLAIRSTVVGTGQWLGNSATVGLGTVGNSSMRGLGDSIARLGVPSLLVTVSVGCLGTETTESIVALAVAGAELAAVAVAEVAVCSRFGSDSAEAADLSASVETVAGDTSLAEVTGTSNSAESTAAEGAADTVSVAEAASVSVAEVVSTAKSFAQ